MPVYYLFLLASLGGVATHLLYFKRGEHHLYVQHYVLAFVASFLIVAVLYRLPVFLDEPDVDWRSAIDLSIKVHGCFLLGLYSSLITYRLFFHPLNKFPGPIGARVSTFWLSFHLRHLDAWRKVTALHDQYGPYVRVGPTELSVRDPKALPVLHGTTSKCEKGPIYDVTKPMTSLHWYREKTLHSDRRRLWSKAFSDRALRGYEKRVQEYRNKLFDRIAAFNGEPMDMAKWFRFYSFDVMGDLAFGKSFNMLNTSRNHWAIDLLDAGVWPLGLQLPVWFLRLGMCIPPLAKDWWKFVGFCKERLQARMQCEPDVPDIMSTLLVPLDGGEPSQEDMDLLTGDAQLIIGAGSHTTAAAMASILYLLAKHPQHVEKLRQELEPLISDSEVDLAQDKAAHLEHLNAVIDEALRLHPPVPTTLYRLTPHDGVMIDGVHVPGGTSVMCPQYAVGRSEAVYSKANSFIPERWYQFPDMVKNKDAFAPFSSGPYGCIGKRLALMDMRQTIARFVCTFDIAFAPGEDGASFERDGIDAFMMTCGELRLSLTKRGV